jgi:glycosyltransferase involved in cell wall biosynthesis
MDIRPPGIPRSACPVDPGGGSINLVVTHEHRFDRTPDGAVWTQVAGAYSFWERYLSVFGRVRVLARVHDTREVPPGSGRADGEGVSFVPLPHYLGPWQYLVRAKAVKETSRGAIGKTDAVILRIPGQIGSCVEPFLRKTQHPYAVEVVGDPYDVFAPGAVRHPLRPLLRWWFPKRMRRQCAGACAAAYVTEYTLQRRYPCPNYSVGISDVEISDGRPSRVFSGRDRVFTILTVGSLSQMYKGTDVLIDAVAVCLREGLDLRLVIAGDGKHRAELEARARSHGLGERARFLGQIPSGPALIGRLDEADLFVLPSRTEGLPRAMIEAMARGLPCIGSTAGGIPELLPGEDMVPPGDIPALARKIREVMSSPARRTRMSERNVEKAHVFRDDILRKRRIDFYTRLRTAMEKWSGDGETT